MALPGPPGPEKILKTKNFDFQEKLSKSQALYVYVPLFLLGSGVRSSRVLGRRARRTGARPTRSSRSTSRSASKRRSRRARRSASPSVTRGRRSTDHEFAPKKRRLDPRATSAMASGVTGDRGSIRGIRTCCDFLKYKLTGSRAPGSTSSDFQRSSRTARRGTHLCAINQ